MEPEAHFIVEETTHHPPRRRIRMDSAFWGTFVLLLIAMCLTVTGETLLKTGMNKYGELNVSFSTLLPTAVKLFSNLWVVGGFVFVFSGALFWLAVLSRWPLSLAYPMLSISYVIGLGSARFILKEDVSWYQLAGVIVIITGVVLVSGAADQIIHKNQITP